MELHVFDWKLVFWQLFVLISFAFWFFAIFDILKSSFKKNDKIVWILVVLFLPILGTIFYFIVGRNQKLELDL
ncbi:PLDc_N domain-containing protein [Aureibaculum sp. A20]|uniref:PLDc_N domain-containing protein n=1 Tax=Aureibaculum flavum TaxID=2795986 RepID=A0ABS0WMF8_9FLAO|nr:PLD nuclease N-terminal domain-containing protein [Aureibaculum flavum]MBJ2173141.1 PLDc_N domain-containing protein [Aureibaculum flavum]